MTAAAGGGGTGNGCNLLERRHRSLGPAYRLFYDRPLHLVEGRGTWLTDVDGRRYLDMYNNVPHVGHCHPRVVDAIAAQAGRLNTHTRYLHENVVRYAERLTALLPDDLDVAMFSCTGSEANELALRIARSVTGRRGIVVIEHAYHGNTQATWEISTEEIPPADRPAHVGTVPAPDTYRGEFRGEDAALRYAEGLRDAVRRLDESGAGFAGFIIDTIASSSGVVEPPPGYLAAVAGIARECGGLFIADEVQPGLGRTGRHFWGFEADGAVPDIVTSGKPMGNGHPLAVTVTRRDLADRFAEHAGYFNTFGGNPVAAAAGLAVLDVIEEESLQDNARRIGSYLRAELGRLADRHAIIGDVRGHGLFLAVDLVDDRDGRAPAAAAGRVVNRLRERGVLTSTIGPHENILKLRPPMVVSRPDADFFLEQLDATLGEL